MFDNTEYKNRRLNEGIDTLSSGKYNAIIGFTLLFGIFLDVIICVFCSDFMTNWLVANDYNIWILIIGYLLVSFGSIAIIYKNDKPIISFIGFTILSTAMGLLLASVISLYSQTAIMDAFFVTGIITLVLTILGSLYPNFFLKLGRVLFITLIVVIVLDILNIILIHNYYSPIDVVIDVVATILFSLYIGYDYAKSQQYIKTVDNAIDSAADIYVDIINLFIRLLSLFGRRD